MRQRRVGQHRVGEEGHHEDRQRRDDPEDRDPGNPDVRAEPIIAALSPQQGMLYYHLLLGRLNATGLPPLTIDPRK